MSERRDLLENIKLAELALSDVEECIRSSRRQISELYEDIAEFEKEQTQKETELTQMHEELAKMDAELPIPELITYEEDSDAESIDRVQKEVNFTPELLNMLNYDDVDPLEILYPSEFEEDDKADE